MAPFDLDTAARFGTGPARLVSLALMMTTRDGADRLTFDPSRRSGAGSSTVECRIGGDWYSLVPPPDTVLPKLTRLLRELAGGSDGRFTARLGGHEFAVRVEIVPVPHPPSSVLECSTLELPVLPELSGRANELLDSHFDENGSVYFDDSEFA
ncbi:hypothetical protein R5W23_006374 [Gemmata sp. JC673]|uniref:Uncharacterized protein n=1 Tax=Gemmata algarum TaxID=2975278 RepID=A0ABU5EVI1_9BACT|nr:hypothetical protein [Gemmata algarum]MDY3559171.1 hypothetical protein [Gemmata algarum]